MATRSTAGRTRPIPLMSSADERLTFAANNDLALVADSCVSPSQRGFVSERFIDADTLGMDGAMAALSLRCRERGAGRLVDFAEAFASLAHYWLFAVQEAMRLPRKLIRFLRSLYRGIFTDLEFRGEATARIVMSSGIRQGCLLSGIVFAFALDPLCTLLRGFSPARAFSLSSMTWPSR